MFRNNPGITHEIVKEAYKQIKNLGLVKTEESNYIFHKWLVDWVAILYKKDGESKTR